LCELPKTAPIGLSGVMATMGDFLAAHSTLTSSG
jgi:hypothetical protein